MTDNNNLHRLRIAADKKTRERNYWLSELAGEPGKSSFPAHYKRERAGKQSADMDTVGFEFSEELSSHLLRSSAGSDVRLHILLVAGLTLLIHKYTGSRDIIVGVPIYKVETGAELINTVLPLRNRLEETVTFKQLVLQVKETIARSQ